MFALKVKVVMTYLFRLGFKGFVLMVFQVESGICWQNCNTRDSQNCFV